MFRMFHKTNEMDIKSNSLWSEISQTQQLQPRICLMKCMVLSTVDFSLH